MNKVLRFYDLRKTPSTFSKKGPEPTHTQCFPTKYTVRVPTRYIAAYAGSVRHWREIRAMGNVDRLRGTAPSEEL